MDLGRWGSGESLGRVGGRKTLNPNQMFYMKKNVSWFLKN